MSFKSKYNNIIGQLAGLIFYIHIVNLWGLKPSISLVKHKYNAMFYLSVFNDVQGDTDIDYDTAYFIYTKSSSCNLSRTIVYTWPSLKAVAGKVS